MTDPDPAVTWTWSGWTVNAWLTDGLTTELDVAEAPEEYSKATTVGRLSETALKADPEASLSPVGPGGQPPWTGWTCRHTNEARAMAAWVAMAVQLAAETVDAGREVAER